jgi:tetratricopeptide (TPR) repeat protein
VCSLRGVLKNSLKLPRGKYAQNLDVTSHFMRNPEKRKILRRKKMKKKLTILIPLLALFIFLAIAVTITVAGSGTQMSPEKLQSLEAQKQIVFDAIAKRDQTKADAAFNQLVTDFSRNPGLSEAVYNIGKDYQYNTWNATKANEAHNYNIEHFPDTKYSMLSQVEIFRSYLRGGKELADADVDKWMKRYKDQPDRVTGIYLLAQAYSGNKKDEEALKLYEYAAKNYPKNIYGILSQIRYEAIQKDYDSADSAADYLFAYSHDNDDVKKGIRELADFYRARKEYARAIHFYNSEIENSPEIKDPIAPYREAIYCYIDTNDIENANKLITEMNKNLSENTNLARANFDIANYFLKAGDSENALSLHEYNVKYYTDSLESLWSQAAIVWYHVRAGNEEQVSIEYAKMLDIYKDQKSLPKEVFQIGDIYLELGNSEKARSFYNQVLNEWSESEYVFNALAGIVKADIKDGYDEAAMIGIDGLITDYIERKELPNTVFLFGEDYWNLARAQRSKDNPATKFPAMSPMVISGKTIEYYTKAQNIWEKIIQNMPSSSMANKAYLFAAEACKITGENEKAIEYFQTIVEKWPDDNMNSHCLNMIASIYQTLQNTGGLSQSEAESKIKKVYEHIASAYPDSAPGLNAISWLSNYEDKTAIQQRNAEARKLFPSRPGRAINSVNSNSKEGAEK